MATSETTSPAETSSTDTLNFTAISGIYDVRADATTLRLSDQLGARLLHLCSMLNMIYGEGFENFSGINEKTQDTYLWACAATANECEQLHDIISRRLTAEGAKRV